MSGERRAGTRFLLHSWVEISGVDESGLQYVERTHREDLGDKGCRFAMRGAVHQGSVVGIKPLGAEGERLADEFPRMFLVIWAKRKGDRLMVGARSLREEEISGGLHTIDLTSNFSGR
jgi:hypothetical protein